MEIYYIFSAATGGIVSSTINFSLNKKFTFKEQLEKSFFKEYWKSGTIKITTGVIGLSLLFVLTDLGDIHYILSSILIMGLTSTTNFLGDKFLTFNK